jgi:hypothetical protein
VYFRMPLSLCRHTVLVPLNTTVPPCCTSKLGSGGLSSPPAGVQERHTHRHRVGSGLVAAHLVCRATQGTHMSGVAMTRW